MTNPAVIRSSKSHAASMTWRAALAWHVCGTNAVRKPSRCITAIQNCPLTRAFPSGAGGFEPPTSAL
jgi:hypothetical protein